MESFGGEQTKTRGAFVGQELGVHTYEGFVGSWSSKPGLPWGAQNADRARDVDCFSGIWGRMRDQPSQAHVKKNSRASTRGGGGGSQGFSSPVST